ncbi:hypothetical protein Smic_63350 [Streptomyces microflavus]|uniref:Response regulatory domain-containing protein n=1 Tax=Streptomyces microflavus TaxID=1919 RepID=A0A7J0CZS8_STRMI|nr:hypothetical protein Smic_63350 [Streptomyces microflavus]
MRVLVVEDEQLLADAVATGLRREAMAVDVVYDGAAALERIGVNDYDVVVLDRDLPVVHGDDVCRKIVELGMPTRVLMLTASGDVSDRVEGLELGADDYLPKPFAFSELTARVRALGRRTTVALPPSWSGPASSSTRTGARSSGTRWRSSSPPRSSRCWRS